MLLGEEYEGCMIDLKDPGGRVAHVMLMEEPVNGVIGIVQCAECDSHCALLCEHAAGASCADEHAKDVEHFLATHDCRADAPNNKTLMPARWRMARARRR